MQMYMLVLFQVEIHGRGNQKIQMVLQSKKSNNRILEDLLKFIMLLPTKVKINNFYNQKLLFNPTSTSIGPTF